MLTWFEQIKFKCFVGRKIHGLVVVAAVVFVWNGSETCVIKIERKKIAILFPNMNSSGFYIDWVVRLKL